MKAIIFDIDDTMYDLCWPFKMAVRECFSDVYDDIIESVYVRSRVHSDEIFEDWVQGKVTADDMYAYRNQKAFADHNIIISRDEALEIQRYYKYYQGKISITDTIKKMLTALKDKKVTLGLISNGGSEHQWAKVHTLGLTKWIPEKNIIISGDTDTAKPDPAIYSLALKKFGIDIADAWYIGDTYINDIDASKKAGWHAVWFNRRKNPLPENGTKPEYEVYTEEEMVKIVMSLADIQ